MVVFSTRDKKEQKGYIITHLDHAYLIDPKGDYQKIMKAIGNATLKAIFLTRFQTDTIPLIASFGPDVPVYVSNANGAYINKVASVMNISMIKFVFVKQILGMDIPELSIRLIPISGIEERGQMLIILNNLYFVGSLVFDEKLVRKAYKLGASSDYFKLVKLIVARNDNIIYPEVGDAFPAKKILEGDLKLRVFFRQP